MDRRTFILKRGPYLKDCPSLKGQSVIRQLSVHHTALDACPREVYSLERWLGWTSIQGAWKGVGLNPVQVFFFYWEGGGGGD